MAVTATSTSTLTVGGGGGVYGESSGGSSSSSNTNGPQSPTKAPSSTTFTFKTPALPLKQRRVSLALPSSPRVVEGWSFRDDTAVQATTTGEPLTKAGIQKQEDELQDGLGKASSSSAVATPEKPEKKARKKWTLEETEMLVQGCNKHGVGNWKTILRDPTLKFDNRSPVDLKDRFRTYYPDAYRQHYPNAKTHLSNKVRSTLPDGKPLFEKTRSKRRRPFTEEEDRALKEGYEKYGTVWATIVKDYPIFQEQNRRSTDLRDRFRNAFPELYSLAGYKPRNAAKKKIAAAVAGGSAGGSGDVLVGAARRAATDDQLGTTSTGGPVRSRRRAYTTQGMLRGGTKSVPQSTACTEDEESSGGEDELGGMSSPVYQGTPVLSSGQSSPTKKRTSSASPDESISMPYDMVEDEEMDMITMDPLAEALALPDILGNDGHTGAHAWSSGVSTPTHSNHWSTAAGSPTSSHLSSDLLMNAGPSHASPPFMQHRSNNISGMIGKSAWGTDWFSPNPRLDPSSNGVMSSSSSYLDQHHSPASPFSFNQLNHGVLDRYDLFPTTMPSDFSSEVGVGDTHSTFSDELFQPSGFRGFTHHSSYAGDLIFGARTHQPQQSFSMGTLGAFGFGSLGLTGLLPFASAQQAQQEQQQQQQQNAGIHPMALHTPSGDGVGAAGGGGADPLGVPLPPETMDDDLMEEDVAMSVDPGHGTMHQQQQQQQQHQHPHQHQHQLQHQQRRASPAKMQGDGHEASVASQQQQQVHQQQGRGDGGSSMLGDAAKGGLMAEPFSLDDLVDLSHDHDGGLGLGGLHTINSHSNNNTTPPATPSRSADTTSPQHHNDTAQPRPLRRSSGSILQQFPSPGSMHARSVSVPPSEFRNHLNASSGGPSASAALLDFSDGDPNDDAVGVGLGHGVRHLNLGHLNLNGLNSLGLGLFGQGQPSISQQLEQAAQAMGRHQQQHQHPHSHSHQQQGRQGQGDGDEDDGTGRGHATIGRRRGRGMVLSSPSSPMGVHQHRSLGGGLGLEALIDPNLFRAPQHHHSMLHHQHQHQQQQQANNEDEDGEGDEEEDGRPQTPTLASSRQLLTLSLPLTPGASGSGGGAMLQSPQGIAPSVSSASSSSQSASSGAGVPVSRVPSQAGSVASSSSSSSASSAKSSLLSPVGDEGWTRAFAAGAQGHGGLSSSVLGLGAFGAATDFNLPFLDLHYYGGGTPGVVGGQGRMVQQGMQQQQLHQHQPQQQHHGLDYGFGGTMPDATGAPSSSSSSVGTGAALDLARGPGVRGMQDVSAGFGTAFGGLKGGYLGGHQLQRGGAFMSSDFAQPHLMQPAMGGGGMFSKTGGLGRSQSHHRGQSHSAAVSMGGGGGVDPRELVVMDGLAGDGGKRKRMSWDGRQV